MSKQNKYLLVRPSEFWSHDLVDLEGNYAQIPTEDFDVDPRFNYCMFEIESKRDNKGRMIFDNVAKELLTGEIFTLSFDKSNSKVRMMSDDLGLYSNDVNLNDILCQPSKMSGIVNYLKENTEVFAKYASEFNALIDASRYHKVMYDETVNGPTKASTRELRRCYRYHGKHCK